MQPPLIAVTGPARLPTPGFGFCTLNLWAAGARVRRLAPPYQPAQLKGLSGVVIGGGGHIDPARYAQESILRYVYDTSRDELEWQVLKVALQRQLPVLGICRGAQIINVYHGGSLFQNLRESIPGVQLRRSVLARKRVSLEDRSLLARIMQAQSTTVNSLHSQGIDRLGEGLRVSGRDAEGVVQAIEREQGGAESVLGVQWHPEYLLNHPPHRRLFGWLVQSAAARAGQLD